MTEFAHLEDTKVDQIMLANARWPSFLNEHKDAINSTIGVLVDHETLHPWRPSTVVAARQTALSEIDQKETYGYLTQHGFNDYLDQAVRFALGDSLAKQTEDVLRYESLGGTGALSLAKDTLATLFKIESESKIPVLLDSGWPNHPAIFTEPFSITTYPHIYSDTGLYNHEAFMSALRSMPSGSLLILQSCAYNDDGSERTRKEWDEIITTAISKQAVLLLDSAYLGLANGLEVDRYPIQQAIKSELLTFVSLSFSKNMGLYNERLGALLIVNARKILGVAQARNLDQLVMRIVRRTISSQPLLSAYAATKVLLNPLYYQELATARQLLNANRSIVGEALKARTPHVLVGKGLFTKLFQAGFSAKQVSYLESSGVLVLSSSRLNLGGMSRIQADRLARVLTELP
jgi:aspartate/tyrosine/aromatic aminotransferase